MASLLQNKKIPGERLLSNGITNEKSDGKALVKKFLNLFLVVAVLGCITGCGRNDQKDKLYYAIDNNNLQGLTEVLADDPDFDFDKLDQHDFTTFRENDHRALSFAFDGIADDIMIMKLIDSGRVDVNNDDDKITYLSNAVCYRSMDIVKALIEHGADVNAGEDTALGSLLRNRTDSIDRQERIELLVSRGAAVDAELFKAALKNEDKYIGMSYVVELLEEHDVDLSGCRKSLIAAIKGDEKTLLDIVTAGREKLTKEDLIFAAGTCSVDTLVKITEAGYDFNIRDENKWTPLHAAALSNDRDAVEYLMKQGLDVNAKTDLLGDNVLDMAVIGANRDTIMYLMERGVKSDEAWDKACREETGGSVRYLMEAGYKPTKGDYYNVFTDSSDSVFDFALDQGFPVNIHYNEGTPLDDADDKDRMLALLEHGANPTAYTLETATGLRAYDAVDFILKKEKDVDMGSALIEAVRCGDFKLVKKYIAHGADVNRLVTDADEKYSALHTAAWSASEDILKYLISNGGDLEVKDSEGRTPYEIVKENRNRINMKIIKAAMRD